MSSPYTAGDSPVILPDPSYGTSEPLLTSCFPSGVSGVYVYPQVGIPVVSAASASEPSPSNEYLYGGWSLVGNIPVPHPNSTWIINGTTLVSHRVVETVNNTTDDVYLPKISSWSGLGMITVQASESTTYITFATSDGIWSLLGTIAGAYGGM